MTTIADTRHQVTISIVIHRQWELVRPLLDQLQRHCSGVIDQVLLTVNLPEAAVRTDPWRLTVRRIDNTAPRGFGANHNAAFRHCRTPWFLVLNPDIRLDSDVLSEMLVSARPEAGLLAPRIREPGRDQPEPFRALLTPMELLSRRRMDHLPPARPSWVAGMFMLFRHDAFARVGGFDQRYFMYCEDFDICARLRLADWDLQVVEEVTVLHDAQRASNASLRPMLWHLASFARLWTSASFWAYAAQLRDRPSRRA